MSRREFRVRNRERKAHSDLQQRKILPRPAHSLSPKWARWVNYPISKRSGFIKRLNLQKNRVPFRTAPFPLESLTRQTMLSGRVVLERGRTRLSLDRQSHDDTQQGCERLPGQSPR